MSVRLKLCSSISVSLCDKTYPLENYNLGYLNKDPCFVAKSLCYILFIFIYSLFFHSHVIIAARHPEASHYANTAIFRFKQKKTSNEKDDRLHSTKNSFLLWFCKVHTEIPATINLELFRAFSALLLVEEKSTQVVRQKSWQQRWKTKTVFCARAICGLIWLTITQNAGRSINRSINQKCKRNLA